MSKKKYEEKEASTSVAPTMTILMHSEVMAGDAYDPCGCTVEKRQHAVIVTDKFGSKYRFYGGDRFALMDGLVYFGAELEQLEQQIKAQAGE